MTTSLPQRNRLGHLGRPAAALALALCARVGGAESTLDELAFWGVPKVETYYARETGVRGDVNSISTLPSGELAVHTTVGLYIFDGTNWSRLEGLDWATRSVALPDGRVLLCFEGGLAELKLNDAGGFDTRLLTPPDKRTSYVHALSSVVAARGHIFGHNGDALIEIDPSGKLTHHKLPNWSNGIFGIGDDLYIIGGLTTLLNRWDWERREFVDCSEVFKDAVFEWMVAIEPRADGGVWLQTETDKIIGFDGERAWLWPGNATLAEIGARVTSLTEAEPGVLAIGTTTEGLIIIEEGGRIVSRFSTEHGLEDVNVLQLGVDGQAGLWVATENGLTRIPRDSRTVVFNERQGLPEQVDSIAFFNGRIFLGAPAGLYANRPSATAMSEAFELALDQGEVTDLLVHDNHLFIAGSKVQVMDANGDTHDLGDAGVSGFWQPSGHPDVILGGNFQGVVRFDKIDGRWERVTRLDGPSESIFSITEAKDGSLFGSLGDNRLARIHLDATGGNFELIELPLPKSGMWTIATQVAGEVYVNGKPCLRWDVGSQSFVEDSRMQYYVGMPPYGFDNVFGVTPEEAYVAVNNFRGATARRPSPQTVGDISSLGNATDTRAVSLAYDSRGNAWAGGRFGLVRSVQPEGDGEKPTLPRIHRLVSINDRIELPVSSTEADPIRLEPSQNALRIEVEFPKFRETRHHQYMIYIYEIDKQWGEFTSDSSRDITNLAPGHYTIYAIVRDATGQTFMSERLDLELAAHWYQRPWAYALFVAACVLLVAGIVAFYNRAQIRRGRKLQRLVQERTQALERQTDTLELQNAELELKTAELQKTTDSLSAALAKLQETQDQLVTTARTAGKAEIATNVLHNVGNVLNSINVSLSVLSERTSKSRIASLKRLSDLVLQHADDLPGFFGDDPKGKLVPEYLQGIARALIDESASVSSEIQVMERDIEHVKRIIAAQQSYAKSQSMAQDFGLRDACETALATLSRCRKGDGWQVINEIPDHLILHTDKHRLLEIVHNLVANAHDSIKEQGPSAGVIHLKAELSTDGESVALSVTDNGVGIDEESRSKLFSHGFTTKSDGHGFGLHSSANAARSLGGSLSLRSPGRGLGATATLVLPLRLKKPVPKPGTSEPAGELARK